MCIRSKNIELKSYKIEPKCIRGKLKFEDGFKFYLSLFRDLCIPAYEEIKNNGFENNNQLIGKTIKG